MGGFNDFAPKLCTFWSFLFRASSLSYTKLDISMHFATFFFASFLLVQLAGPSGALPLASVALVCAPLWLLSPAALLSCLPAQWFANTLTLTTSPRSWRLSPIRQLPMLKRPVSYSLRDATNILMSALRLSSTLLAKLRAA